MAAVIRDATASDRTAVRELQALLEQPAPALLTAAFDLDDYGAGGDVLVADDGDVVGYALVVPGRLDATPSVVYLAELSVASAVRREGYATRLVEAITERYDAYDQLRVTVAADDAAARSFYASTGFRTLDTLPERFGDTDGRLLVRGLS